MFFDWSSLTNNEKCTGMSSDESVANFLSRGTAMQEAGQHDFKLLAYQVSSSGSWQVRMPRVHNDKTQFSPCFESELPHTLWDLY